MVIGGKLGIEGTSSDDEVVPHCSRPGSTPCSSATANPDELPTALQPDAARSRQAAS